MTEEVLETYRRARRAELNGEPSSRAELEAKYGQVWSTDELTAAYAVKGFMAPYVVVTRLSDGVVGSMEFAHRPRFYFNFVPDSK